MAKAKAKTISRIADLTPDSRNANKGTERGTGLLEQSLRQYGAGRSVLADRKGRLIAGNKTVESAASIGLEKVRVVQTDGTELVVVQRTDLDLDSKAARELAIADNRVGQVSLEWDAAELEATARDFDIDLASLGFSDDEMAKLSAEDAGEVTEDEIPTDVPERCKSGDVWTLGSHRLMCGDSTDAAAVAVLLDGGKPFLMVTDPPYGVDYNPQWREDAADKGLIGFGAKRMGKVDNDKRADWSQAWALFPGSVMYVWHASTHSIDVGMGIQDGGFQIRSSIIWRKPSFAISRGHYHWQHEPCWYAVRKGATAKWVGDRSQSTVWDVQTINMSGARPDDAETDHGTQKPVECMARPIRNHGSKGDDVYDPFLGSGTTLIACEQLGRRCYGMEISPTYCDVILARWEKLTGKVAQKASQGPWRAFCEV